jgi:hypothetical protein
MKTLPAPEVMDCSVDDRFDPRLRTMRLRWSGHDIGRTERLWDLPEGVSVVGPAPERFGVTIQRRELDHYAVRLVWNHTCFSWASLGRVQLLTSALAPLLRAIGSDLHVLLDQPVHGESGLPKRA